MLRQKLSLLLLVLMVLCSTAQAQFLTPSVFLGASLNGKNEPTPVATGALGVASFTINKKLDKLFYYVNVNKLSSKITGITLNTGKQGVSGIKIYDLTITNDSTLSKGYIIGLTKVDIENITTGNIYINVCTVNNPNGEIRGQVIIEKDPSYLAMFDGAQQVPSSSSKGVGLATFRLNKSKTVMNVNIVFTGIDTIKSAHIHFGPKGKIGKVALDFSQFSSISGNYIQTTIILNDTHNVKDYTAFINALDSGNLYVNLHTASYANGEIRGQILPKQGIDFESFLSGVNISPKPVFSGAIGLATIKLNPTLDSAYIYAVIDGVNNYKGCELNYGREGKNGSNYINLEQFRTGNVIKGSFAVSTDARDSFLSQRMYVLIKDSYKPNGLLRSNTMRFNREGFLLDVSGGAVNPSITSSTKGGGYVSVAPDKSNGYVNLNFNNLSSTLTGASFFVGLPRTNGNEIIDFFPDVKSNALEVDWSNGWNSSNASKLTHDSIYFLIKTTSNKLGDCRGTFSPASFFVENSNLETRYYGGSTTLVGDFNGNNLVPASNSAVKGIAGVSFSNDGKSIYVGAQLNNIGTDSITKAFIKTSKGKMIDVTSMVKKDRISGYITQKNMISGDTINTLLTKGGCIQINSKAFPKGMVAAPLFLKTEKHGMALLTNSNMTSVSANQSKGLFYFNFNPITKTCLIDGWIIKSSSKITKLELRTYSTDADSGIFVKDITNFLNKNKFTIEITQKSTIDSLLNGQYQIMLKTITNPLGEIKGKIKNVNWNYFTSDLKTLTMQPVNIATSSGKLFIAISPKKDSFIITGFTFNSRDTMKVLNIYYNIPGGGKRLLTTYKQNQYTRSQPFIYTIVSGKYIDSTLLYGIYGGNLSVIVTNLTYPNGEMEGNIIPEAEDNYLFDLCGNQVVSPVTTTASGMGYIRINSGRNMINYAIVGNGLSGSITSATINKGAAGSNGTVDLDITSSFNNNMASGTLINADSSKYTSLTQLEYATGLRYITLATAANSTGEIRGIISQGAACDITFNGIEEFKNALSSIKMYPNPVKDELHLLLNAANSGLIQYQIINLEGRMISSSYFKVVSGPNQLEIPVNELTSGLYLIKLNTKDGQVSTLRFVKSN